MHDCLPPYKAAALPTKHFPEKEETNVEGWTGFWCGDVWKSIVYLRKNYPELLDVCVLNTDYGLGIVRIKNSIAGDLKIDEKSYNEIDKMTYDEMILDPKSILNLKDADYARKIIEEVATQK